MATIDPQAALRPRSIGELLDLAFRIYRRRFGLYAALGIVTAVPLALIGGVYQLLVLGAAPFGTAGQPALDELLPLLVTVYGSLALLLLLNAVLGSCMAMAATAATDDLLRGSAPSWREVWRRALPRCPSAIGTALLVWLATFGAVLLCCLPAIPVAVGLILAVPLVYLERRGPVEAIGRSWSLVMAPPRAPSLETPWVRVVLVGLVTLIVVYVLNFLAGLPGMILMFTFAFRRGVGVNPFATPLPPALLLPAQVVGGVLQGLFFAIPVIPWTLLYHDLRARREGADIEEVARRLAARGAPDGT